MMMADGRRPEHGNTISSPHYAPAKKIQMMLAVNEGENSIHVSWSFKATTNQKELL